MKADTTRRDFLKTAAAVTVAMSNLSALAADAPAPWYRRTVRWGQTNITQADVKTYDVTWWRKQWKRTQVQGVIINAGGIFAYYPSKFPLHYRFPELGERDLYGELAKAAHDDGLAVLARMDSSKVHEAAYRAHPEWVAVDADNRPYRSGEFYLTCISSPYYEEFLPGVLREIIERSHSEGITDNSWSGLDRNSICYCQNCRRRFGRDLPARHDWDDPVFRQWIRWSYARRIEQWDFNNPGTRAAGGADCLWVGMNGAGIGGQGVSFRDLREICSRAQIIMLDNQSRTDADGFQENQQAGKLIHSLLGWDKLIPESMATYQHGRPQFRLSAKPVAEARQWMLAGFAGGIQPWWHHVGAYHEDRRVYRMAEPVTRWHKANERYLLNRRPVASVAVGWSQLNSDFYGRETFEELVEQPWRGFTQALVRARIPWLPLHLDDLDRDGGGFAVLILPNVGAMPNEQIESVRRFVRRGGALVASGQTSLFDADGNSRSDFALADLFGVSGAKPAIVPATQHTYLRLTPELRGGVDGPMRGDEPKIGAARHPILAGFEETDILPFGGTLEPLTVDAGATTLLTYVPPVPATPPEIVWMRQPQTNVPGLVVNEQHAGRVVYLPADVDRRFALHNFPDHGDLLANVVRWAAGDSIPLRVDGSGLIGCELYRQENRLILHVVNLTSAATWRAPMHECIALRPLNVQIRLPNGFKPGTFKSLVGGGAINAEIESSWAKFQLASVLDHEVVVVES